MVSPVEKKYYLAFSAFGHIGPVRIKEIISYFGSAQKAWCAQSLELLKSGLGKSTVEKLAFFKKKFIPESFIAQLEKNNIKTIFFKEKNYPELLAQIADPPYVLYYRGNLKTLIKPDPKIAVVGSRCVTSYGREITNRLVGGLVSQGVIIVSGLAYGVDTTAHQAALDNHGLTIAVLGSGIDTVYPTSNRQLYWDIINNNGLVLSEYPPGRHPEKSFFPQRNRIVSGLSLGTVVVEGKEKSGSLITARLAAEQGREVFAVPGPITSEYSKAPYILLKQGAKLVSETSDILEELNIPTVKVKAEKVLGMLAPIQKKVYETLSTGSLYFNEITIRTGIASAKLTNILTDLELAGIVKSSQGKYFLVK